VRNVTGALLIAAVLLSVAAGTAVAAANEPRPSGPGKDGGERDTSGRVVAAETAVSGPLGGKTITFKDRKRDKDRNYNSFSIEASNCTVAPTGAVITFEDDDGTQAQLVEPNEDYTRTVDISATSTQVLGKGLYDRKKNIGFVPVEGQPGDGFIDRNATVISSEGITCA
jgi:hypothetical protein